MTIKIGGFSEILDILKGMYSGINAALQIPEENRKEMKDALANTAELIDQTLIILKQHLTSVLSELKFGDKQKAKQMIFEIDNFQGWETTYRQFQLCDKLRGAAINLERKGLYKLITNLTVNNPDKIKDKMWDYIGGETNAAISVATMLQGLSRLEKQVDTDFDNVVKYLEDARDEIGKCRQRFIDLEKEMRL